VLAREHFGKVGAKTGAAMLLSHVRWSSG